MARYTMVILDLQFGSTGKGQLAGTMGLQWKPDTVVTAWGPNAGHTFRNGEFQGVSTMLASAATAPSIRNILIGPGSVIDLAKLSAEIGDRGRRHLDGKTLIIHPQAILLQPTDAEIEATELKRIGSTMKGTGHAMCRKVMREPGATAGSGTSWVYGSLSEELYRVGMAFAVSSQHYDRAVDQSERLLIEGAQGFSLGLHTDFYPHCTGRDVSTAQMFADCRIPWPGSRVPRPLVIGTARTFPIRVANRYEERPVRDEERASRGGPAKTERVMVGSSGGWYDDQEETTWDKIGREVELTTVTKLPRRVFTFSMQQLREAVRVCGADMIALTFCDYLPGGPEEAERLAENITCEAGAPVRLMSFGPDIADISVRTIQGGLVPLKDTNFPVLGGDWPYGS